MQCLETRDVADFYPPADPGDAHSAHRVVVGGFTLTVDPTVIPAAGGRV